MQKSLRMPLWMGLLLTSVAQAQPVELTLEKSVAYAVENHETIKKSLFDEEMAKYQVSEVRGVGLPQISGKVDIRHNLKLQPMFLPASGDGGESPFGAIPPKEVREKSVVFDNFFMLPSSGDASITVSQLLFDGSYLVGLKAAKVYRELSSKTTQMSKRDVKESVTKAYYMVLINRERKALYDSNIERLEQLLEQTQKMYDNGLAEKLDVQRIKVSKNNLETERSKFDNMQLMSELLLKYNMGLDINTEIVLTDSLQSYVMLPETVDVNSSEVNFENRIEYSLLGTQRMLYQLDMQKEQVSRYPSLAAFGSAGFVNQNHEFSGDLFTNKWFSYGLVGVSLNVPIFSGFVSNSRIQKTKVNIKKVEEDVKTLERSVTLQEKQSKLNLKNSLQTLDMQKDNVALAEEVARVTKIKFREGVGSNLEVTTAETELKEAQINYFNSLYEAMINQVEYLKALGTL